MAERAFVAGATGYTGRSVVSEMVARGVEVIAHVRPDSPRLEDWRRRFTALGATFDCTPWGRREFDAVIKHYSPNYVFGLLGTTRARARKARKMGKTDSYETVDYALGSIVLESTAAMSPAAKFVYLSAIGVRHDSLASYLAVRYRLERRLQESGLNYVIARPALITGADREDFRLAERAAAGAVRALSTIARATGFRDLVDRFATMTGPQLGRALVAAALDPALANVILEVPQLIALAKR